MIRNRLRFGVTCYRCVVGTVIVILVLLVYMKDKKCNKQEFDDFSEEAKKYVYFKKEELSDSLNATELQNWIRVQNVQEQILNLDLYGPVTSDTLFLVIPVYKDSCYLNYLLASLSELKGIQDTVIIFSHSYVDHNVNRLIQSRDFSRILQLFYPYSIQAYPNKFPGYQKNNCPSHLNTNAAEKLNCAGAKHPDIHGRYRSPIHAERKHHWWWTDNKVFEDLTCTDGHKGIVVFLQDTYFLIKDFIYFAHRMKTIADSLPQCDFLSSGTIPNVNDNKLYSLEFASWDPKYHSNVLSMDVSDWNSIQAHYDIFCLVDDYSWSRSLLHVSLNRRYGERFKVLSSKAPRALHITPRPTCSYIAGEINCDVIENIFDTLNFQKRYEEIWFPTYIEVYSNIELEEDEFMVFDHIEKNGGWNDPRDKQLCSNISMNKAKKYLWNTDTELVYNDFL